MKNIYKLIFMLVLIPKSGFAYEKNAAFSKEKNISKSFDVNADAQLRVSNSYGNINVYLWDENKISIQISIKVSGNNEKKVIEKLNSIDVSFDASSSKVSAASTFENSNWKNGNNISYEINYVVKIPRKGSIELNNKYGNISVDKLNGTSSIDCKYGNLYLGNFTNKSNNITLSYSSDSNINSIEKLNLNCQYSQVEFQNIDSINISGNYNGFTFQNVGTLYLNSNYTKINSKSIQKFDCKGNYLTLKLGEIEQSCSIESNYSDINLEAISKTKKIIINGNYTNSKISCPTDFDFDLEINLKYGSLKEVIGLKYIEKSEKNNSKSYIGYHLSQGKASLSINSNYGNVQLLNK